MKRTRGQRPEPTPKPDPTVIANRPHQAPSAHSCFVTNDNVDAQLAWMAHIDAGRIKVR